jgi:hypothetical protein
MHNTLIMFVIIKTVLCTTMTTPNFTVSYVLDEELPEYIPKNRSLEGLAIMTENSDEQFKKNLELLGGTLCAFNNDSTNKSNGVLVYCFIIALAWILLILAFCLGTVHKIVVKVREIINGFQHDRKNNYVNDKQTTSNFQGVFSC